MQDSIVAYQIQPSSTPEDFEEIMELVRNLYASKEFQNINIHIRNRTPTSGKKSPQKPRSQSPISNQLSPPQRPSLLPTTPQQSGKVRSISALTPS